MPYGHNITNVRLCTRHMMLLARFRCSERALNIGF